MRIEEELRIMTRNSRTENGFRIFIRDYIRAPEKIFDNGEYKNLNEYLYIEDLKERERIIGVLINYGFSVKLDDLYHAYTLYSIVNDLNILEKKVFLYIIKARFNCIIDLLIDPNNKQNLVEYLIGIKYNRYGGRTDE